MELNEKDLKNIITRVINEDIDLYGSRWKEADSVMFDMARHPKRFKSLNTEECDEKQEIENGTVDETVFQLNPKDPALVQKMNNIKSNSAIYDKTKDSITLSDTKPVDTNTFESVYKKSDVVKLINEAKNKKNATDDYLDAIKKADREMEYELNGPGWKSKDKAHKNKKAYNRKRDRKNVDECSFTKNELNTRVLEKMYNGKLYKKSELIESFKNTDDK